MFTIKEHADHFEIVQDPIIINATTIYYFLQDGRDMDGQYNKIQAIKLVRNKWNIGLKDAKEIVERVAVDNSITFGGLT